MLIPQELWVRGSGPEGYSPRNGFQNKGGTARVEGKAGEGGSPKPKEEHFKKQVQLESSAAKRNKIAIGS